MATKDFKNMNKNFIGCNSIDGYVKAQINDYKACINSKCKMLDKCLDINGFMCQDKVNIEFYKVNVNDDGYFHNITPNDFLEQLAITIAGTSTPSLPASHIGLSAYSDDITKTTAIEGEIGRVAKTSATASGNIVTVESTFGLTDANTAITTIASVTSASIFTVNSITGFAINQRIRVNVTGVGLEDRKIQGISSNKITLSTPLSASPTVGDSVNQLITRVQLVRNGTLTLNSGSGLSIAPFVKTKLSTQTLAFTHTIKFI